MQSHNGLLNNGITSLDFTNPFAEPNNPPTDKTAAAFFAYLAKNQDKLIFDKGTLATTEVDKLKKELSSLYSKLDKPAAHKKQISALIVAAEEMISESRNLNTYILPTITKQLAAANTALDQPFKGNITTLINAADDAKKLGDAYKHIGYALTALSVVMVTSFVLTTVFPPLAFFVLIGIVAAFTIGAVMVKKHQDNIDDAKIIKAPSQNMGTALNNLAESINPHLKLQPSPSNGLRRYLGLFVQSTGEAAEAVIYGTAKKNQRIF